jgi:ElaB/YqjD/DUF883 family membrane-anchored ribosome-binding protein
MMKGATLTMAEQESMANCLTQLSEDFASFRTEIRAEISSFRTEIRAEISSFRTEIKSVTELHEPLVQMVDAWEAVGGAAKVGLWFGIFVKWATIITTPFAVAYAAFKGLGH